MNKKYVYEFVNETVEIEISEEWEAVLKEIDREALKGIDAGILRGNC